MVNKQKILIWNPNGELTSKVERLFSGRQQPNPDSETDAIQQIDSNVLVQSVDNVAAALEILQSESPSIPPCALIILSGDLCEQDYKSIIQLLGDKPTLEVMRFLDSGDPDFQKILSRSTGHNRYINFLGPKLSNELAYIVSAALSKATIRRNNLNSTKQEENLIHSPEKPRDEEIESPSFPMSNNSSESLHSQKLEAVGQLAAGIAHEINTPIQFVSDSIHFLADCFEDLQTLLEHYQKVVKKADSLGTLNDLVKQVREYEEEVDLEYLMEAISPALKRTVDGVQRVAEIVRAMKEFARPDMREMASADLNRAIMSTLVVARAEYRYVAEVETDLQEIPQVTCHLGDVNQVFLNLIVNAAHAIADKNKASGDSSKMGKIVVRSRIDGDHVVIEIEDSGTGIEEEVRSRIFDPFFTTKEVGRGTGQGLAIARTIIIEKHGGEIEVMSQVGQGTTFRVSLPIHSEELSENRTGGQSLVA